MPLVQDSLMCLAVTIFYFFCNYASSTEATCVLGVDKDNKKCFALFTGAAYRLTIKNVFMTAIAAINQVLQPPTKSIAVFNIFYISSLNLQTLNCVVDSNISNKYLFF